MNHRTNDAHTGAHEYADKEAHRVSTKVRKAIQYSCGLTHTSVKELQKTAYRLAYDEAYGPVYRDLLHREIESRVLGLKDNIKSEVLDTVREAFDRFNAEREAVHVTTFEENAELVRQVAEQDDADRLADLQDRAAELGCEILINGGVGYCGDDCGVAPEYQGPYALTADGGYVVHVPGVNLDLLEKQITQIEREQRS